jgi:phosphatidylglycerol:prolipoprotein diacylglycerol transferase
VQPLLFHWNFEPVLFASGPLTVRWYGVLWAIAFLVGEWIARREFVRLGRPDVDVAGLAVTALAGTVIGARLVHVFVYDPALYLEHPAKILALWEGGLASHGGVIGFLVALAIGKRRFARDVSLLTLADVATIPAAVGGALVRIGNFLNSEILGVPTNSNWGVVFERVDPLPRHPVQLYEATAYLIVALVLWSMASRSAPLRDPGRGTGIFMLGVFGARAILEIWKTPQAAYDGAAAVSAGQWLSAPFLLIGIWLAIRSARRA